MKSINFNPVKGLMAALCLGLFLACGGSNFTPTLLPQTHLGNISLNSSEDILRFFQDNITVVSGDLTIGLGGPGNETPITDLELLTKLERVSGRLQITNTQLTSLRGLDSLQHTGELIINRNQLLENIENLGKLETKSLIISQNQSLNSLAGMSSMEASMDLLQINTCPELGSLIGLEFLETVDRLVVVDNAGLQSVEGLNSLEVVDGDFDLSESGSLQNLNGLSSLNTINGTLRFIENGQLQSMAGAESIISLGALLVRENPQLASLDGFENLSTLSSLIIEENASLQNLNGLSGLSHSATSLSIINNSRLTDFCGLSNLVNSAEFGGEFSAIDNAFNPNVDDIRSGDCKDE